MDVYGIRASYLLQSLSRWHQVTFFSSCGGRPLLRTTYLHQKVAWKSLANPFHLHQTLCEAWPHPPNLKMKATHFLKSWFTTTWETQTSKFSFLLTLKDTCVPPPNSLGNGWFSWQSHGFDCDQTTHTTQKILKQSQQNHLKIDFKTWWWTNISKFGEYWWRFTDALGRIILLIVSG